MKKHTCILWIILCSFNLIYGQEHKITIEAQLDDQKDILQINQSIIYHNTSDSILNNIILHNWINGYKNNKSPLANRLIEDYDKSLFFAKQKDRGYSTINNLNVDYEKVKFLEEEDNKIDIIRIVLNTPLKPKTSTLINVTYTVKIPNSKFTSYGKTKSGYHLRYWYLIPAVFHDNWKVMSNLNMDDLLTNSTNYNIKIRLPKYYHLSSNLKEYKTEKATMNEFLLNGKQMTEVLMNIDIEDKYRSFRTNDFEIKTDLFNTNIDNKLSTNILNRQLEFIQRFLGTYPHKKLLIDKATQSKNPIYGLNQLPKFIRPFPDVFEWDLTLLKALSKKYIDNTLLLDKRKDYWLTDGLQTYLMMNYVTEYYPEIKLTGNISKIWGLKNFNFSKLKFNDKYPFIYQYTARQFLDQALNTRADSLSNFNRKIVGKYKAGLGLRYLADYIGDSIISSSFQEFYFKNKLKYAKSDDFKKIVSSKTNKDISWFFGDYLKTNKKIDYTIKKA